MTILLDKKRKSFGKDISFDDFVELLKSLNVLLNFDNSKIISALKETYSSYYCSTDGKINKDTLKKDVIKRLTFIKSKHYSTDGLKERGFDDDFISKYKRERNKLCVEYWIKKGFSEDYAREQISQNQSKRGKLNKGKTKIIDKEYIESIGVDSVYFFRKRSCWCKEYWINKGYTEDEAKEKISELQKELALRNSIKSPLERKKYNKKCVVYWTNKGYTEDEAKEKISELQKTFSLEKCVNKYGKEDGLKRWKQRQEKWQETLNKKGFHQLGHSKISQELFNEILNHYDTEDKDYVFFEEKNKEYTLKNDNGFFYRYDFCDLNKRKFIEFNGDIYHANPKMFSPLDKPNPFKNKTSEELWKIDEDKKKIAERNGFEELIIWEKDYRENKEKIIKDCLNFLKI